MFLHRLLYRSDAALVGSDDEVDDQVRALVDASRRMNEVAGLTGALLLSSGVFIQALEGPLDAVEAAFERICGDLRHRRVRLLQLAVIESRLFAEWSMSKVTPTAELARVCPALDVPQGIRLDATRANAALQMMRALLVAKHRQPSRPEPV